MQKILLEDSINHAPKLVFDTIIDVESYPGFLPWCRGIHIIKKDKNKISADVIIGFNMVTQQYRSNITFLPPSLKKDTWQEGIIEVEANSGPFKKLYTKWIITPQNEDKTHVKFYIEYEFKSLLYKTLMSHTYKKAQGKIISSFQKQLEKKSR